MAVPALITNQGPAAVLASNRSAAVGLATKSGLDRLLPVLEKANADLKARLTHARGLSGPGQESFTVAKLESTLLQVRQVLAEVKAGLEKTTLDTGKQAAELAAQSTAAYLRETQAKFKGIHQPLQLKEAMLFDRAVRGTESSLLHRLQGDPKKGPGILARYGAQVVEKFEGVLQQRFAQGATWDDTRKGLIQESPFLQGAPAHWAERIVRTEVMGAHGAASWEALREADDQLGDMVKILCATFDDRTAADSYAVHGQIRRPAETFETWEGHIQHPPARPNDREIVVPHRISWPIPDSLKWRTDAEVRARFLSMGGKGSPPPRPNMTTVEMDKFGKPQPLKVVPKPQAILEPLGEQPPAPPEVVAPMQPMPLPPPAAEEPQKPLTLAPAPRPQVVAPEVPRADTILAEKVGGQAGSNEGGLYRGADGVERYVKFYDDPAQAQLEHLANVIYDDLGLGRVKSELFEARHPKTGDKVTAYASTIIPGEPLKTAGLTPKVAQTVMKGFAADVLTANWDAVGMGLDNVLVPTGSKGLHVERIDKGGTFLFRAKQGRKPLGVLTEIPEWEGFFSSKNPDYSRVAKEAGVTSAEQIKGLAGQIKAIKKLRDLDGGGWDAYVKHNAPGLSAADHLQTVAMLEQRTILLGQKLKTLTKARVKPKPGTQLKFEELPTKAFSRSEEPIGWKGGISSYRDAEDRKYGAWSDAHPDQRMVLRDYVGSGYRELLATKRMTREEFNKKYGSEYNPDPYERKKAEYEALRSAFHDAPKAVEAAYPMTPASQLHPEASFTELYRGEGGWNPPDLQAIMDAHTSGKAHQFDSVVSSTYSSSTARSFGSEGRSRGEYAIMYHIKTRQTAAGKFSIANPGEGEVLLDESLRFRIAAVHKMEGRSKTLLVSLEELAPGEEVGAATKPKKPKKTARYFYTKNGVEQVGKWMHADSLEAAEAQVKTWNEEGPAVWAFVKKMGIWDGAA